MAIVFIEADKSTRKLAALRAGDAISAFIGPLGPAIEPDKVITVVCKGGTVQEGSSQSTA